MITKVINTFKYAGLFSFVFFSIISCEKEIESIGVNLVDNDKFSTDKFTSNVITENKNIENVPANGIEQYLLGVYSDKEFGSLKASIVSQLILPSTGDNYNFGTNPAIDSVLINIPYQFTKEDDESDGKPKFSIDSVIGNKDEEFLINVYELKTFLNTLDPNDPSKKAIYYSDKEFQKGDTPLYSGAFKINPSDTVAYIKRYKADAITVYDTDTIKETDVSPSIKIPLNETMIQQLFVDNASGSEFSSLDDFNHYFRGLYIEATELNSLESHLISLSMTNAKMTIYYSKDEDEDADEDLDGNGTTGETGVRTKHDFKFLFSNLKSNVLTRDYTQSKESGDNRLYVQGAAGSEATVELLQSENLENLKSKNWLINEANLTFYVDQNASSNIVPEQLFLYNYEDNLQIRDIITEGVAAVGGTLERDEDGNPFLYKFKITDYISSLLSSEDETELVKLGLKVYNSSTDIPTSITDVKIENKSWNPKGVVLYDGSEISGDKKVKLEIFYTEINN
ncbi:DUF4270 domain-containing protein [uncultured Lutibacter sp.]|uniref:DUF4270 domain-containing protein n=1 Tax=uncultured Lutibacter sp. TaxID=437739 RepID=UPI00260A583F|nr:DUF4270 domain-containing protein [uncultured Lutibacter sp.]